MASHVVHGGSSAYIWTVCPASVSLGELAGPDESGIHAARGTAAHAVAEKALRLGTRCEEFIGWPIEGVEIDSDIASAAQVYVDWVNNMAAHPGSKLLLEHPVDLEKLKPIEPMRGTADAVILLPSLRRLVVADYKNGYGVVEHIGNKQTRYYALGALLTLDPADVKGIDTVQLTIVQPNAAHPDGPIRSETIHLEELLDFAEELLEAQRRTREPNPRAVPGSHCTWCKGRDLCTARRDGALVAAEELESVIERDPDLLPAEKTAETLRFLEPRLAAIEAWVKTARARIEREVKAGRTDLGYKLVPKRAARVWNNEQEVINWATSKGLGKDEIYGEPALLSVAQLEKLVGKKELPAGLYSAVSTGENLVPATDPRPSARVAAADEFNADV